MRRRSSSTITAASFARSLEKLQSDWEKLEECRSDKEIEHFVEVGDLKTEKKRLESEVENLKKQLEQTQKVFESQKKMVEATKANIAKQKMKLSKEVIALRFELGDSNERIKSLEKSLEEKNNEDGSLTSLFEKEEDDKKSTFTSKTEFLSAVSSGDIDCITDSLNPMCTKSNSLAKLLGTALVKSCASGQLEAIQMLLKYGADLRVRNEQGRTCLHCAVTSRNPDILACILEQLESDQITGNENTDDFENFDKKNVSTRLSQIRLELLNATDEAGLTALHLAARSDKTANMVRMLMRQGVDIEICTPRGQTALELNSSTHVTSLWGNSTNRRGQLTVKNVICSLKQRFWNKSKAGTIQYKAKCFSSAVVSFSAALEVANDDKTLDITKLDKARLHYNCGRAALQCRPSRVVISLEHAEVALKLAGELGYSGALAMRGECNFLLMDYARAARDFTELVTSYPSRDESIQKDRKRKLKMMIKCRDASHYDILGIAQNAKENEIQKAFRKESVRWHPDKVRHRARRGSQNSVSANEDDKTTENMSIFNCQHLDPDTNAKRATIHFKRINEARQVLSDARERVMYDVELSVVASRKYTKERRRRQKSRRWGTKYEEDSDEDSDEDEDGGVRKWPWSKTKSELKSSETKSRSKPTYSERYEKAKERQNAASSSLNTNYDLERERFREWQREQAELRRERARSSYEYKSVSSSNKRNDAEEEEEDDTVEDTSSTEEEEDVSSSESEEGEESEKDEEEEEEGKEEEDIFHFQKSNSFVTSHSERLEQAMKYLGVNEDDMNKFVKEKSDMEDSSSEEDDEDEIETPPPQSPPRKEKKKKGGFWAKALKRRGGAAWWGTGASSKKKKEKREEESLRSLSSSSSSGERDKETEEESDDSETESSSSTRSNSNSNSNEEEEEDEEHNDEEEEISQEDGDLLELDIGKESLNVEELEKLLIETNKNAAALEKEMDDMMGSDLLRRADEIEKRMDSLLNPLSNGNSKATPPIPPSKPDTKNYQNENVVSHMAERDGLPLIKVVEEEDSEEEKTFS